MRRTHTLILLAVLLLAGVFVATAPTGAQESGEINLTIEPGSSELEPGAVQTYEVIVEDPDSGISAYDEVVIDLSDPGVGTIVDFEEQFDESGDATFSNSEIRNGGATLYLEALTGESFAAPADEVTIATFDLQAAETAPDDATTGIAFDQSAAQSVADFDNVAPYTVEEFGSASMTVDVEFPAILELTSVDAPDTIDVTEDLTVDYTIENVGDATGVESAVELVIDVVEPTVEDSDTDVTVDPGESVSGTLVYDEVGSLAPGVTIDYTVRLVDFGDNVSGSTVIGEGEPVTTLSNLDIAGQGEAATIVEGDSGDVTIDVTNDGNVAEVFDVALTVYEGDFESVFEAGQSTGEVGPGETETVVFEDVTGGIAVGDYAIELVGNSDGGDDDAIFGDLTVEAGEPAVGLSNLDIDGQGAEATIVEGVDADIAVDVTNVGEGSGSFDLLLDITTEGDRGVRTGDSTGVLSPGETETVVFEAVTGGLDPGSFGVEVTAGGELVTGDLTVEGTPDAEPALADLDIAGQGSAATVLQGAAADIAAEVENVGDGAGTFDVTLGIDTLNGDPVASYDLTTGVVSPGETETVVFEGVTAGLGTGGFAVEIGTEGSALPLFGSLTVEEGELSLLSNLDIAGQGPAATVPTDAARDVTVDVTNVLNTGQSFDVTLQVGDASTVETTGPLDPGQAETVTFESVTGDLDTGVYGVSVSALDSQTVGNLTVVDGVDVNGDGNPATDTDGDGLLNDVDGDGSFTIFDVQTFFTRFTAGPVQNNPALFNFDEQEPPAVTIFDVQALFAGLSA